MKALILLPFLFACQTQNDYDVYSHCEGKDRILAIDETYSQGRIFAIMSASEHWQGAMRNQGAVFHPQVQAVVDTFDDACTIKVINTVPTYTKDGRIGETNPMDNEQSPPSSAVIRMSENASLRSPDNYNLRLLDREFFILAEHEIGHALGLQHLHYEDHVSIMEPNFYENQEIAAQEIEMVCELWDCL